MLLSLLVYSLTGVALFLLGLHVNGREQRLMLETGKRLPFYSWEILLSMLLFAIVAGARYHTGYDHAMYLDQYQHLLKAGEFSRHNFEYGFEWISKIFACSKMQVMNLVAPATKAEPSKPIAPILTSRPYSTPFWTILPMNPKSIAVKVASILILLEFSPLSNQQN